MRAKKIEHRAMRGRLADRFPQTVGSQPGQLEKPPRAGCVRKDPAERSKGNPGRVLNRIFRPVKNCQSSVKEIMVAKASVGAEASGAQ